MTPSSSQRGETFFTLVAVALFGVVLGGFGPSFYARSGSLPPLSAMFAWHGVSLTAWYLLVIVQGALLGLRFSKGTLRLHRRLGLLSLIIALAVVSTGAIVAFDFYRGGTSETILTPAGLLTANLLNLFSFSVCYVAGVALRRQPELHKRFLSLAGIVMIGPAAFRLVVNCGLAPPVSLVVQLGFVAVLFGYDRRRLRRISKASWIGLGLIFVQVGGTLAVG